MKLGLRKSRLRRRYGRMTQMPLPFNRSITNVLGESRQIEKVYSGGDYNCPFCNYAAKASGCENPICSASLNALAHAETARPRFEQYQREHEARLAEEARRQRDREISKNYYEESRKAQATRQNEVEQEAHRRGACVRCAIAPLPYGAPKFVKHRGACPKAGR
jgi:hypothetical protein